MSSYRGHLGYRAPAMSSLFPASLCGLPSDIGPRFLAIPGSSSRELLLLYRVQTCFEPARRDRSPPNAFHGVLPLLSDIRATSLLSGKAPTPCLRSAHSVSHTLDGLLLVSLCGLISSHYHFRDLLYRGFPPRPAVPNSSLGRALMTFCDFPLAAVQALRLQVQPTGLQSVTPNTDPLRLTAVLPTASLRSPLELSTPSGFQPNTLRWPSPPLRSQPWSQPPHSDDCNWPTACHQCSTIRTVPSAPPRSSFLTFRPSRRSD